MRKLLKRWLSLALSAAMLTGLAPTALAVDEPGAPAAGNPTLRIGTFNIAAVKKLPHAAQAELVDANGIDVVGLQEVDMNTQRNPRNMLQDFLDSGDMEYGAFQKAIDHEGGEYGIAMASKTELTDVQGGPLYSEGVTEARAWQRGVVTVDGKQVAVYNTHLSWEEDVTAAMTARTHQMEQLVYAVNSDTVPYRVILGDFNADQSHTEWYTFLKTLNMANGGEGTWYNTFNGTDATMKTMAIDNIITSRNIAVSNVTVVNTKTSDHNLFFADLELLDEDQPSRQLLNQLLGDAAAIDTDAYTADSAAALADAVAAANALAADAAQADIDSAAKALSDAIAALVAMPKKVNLALNQTVTVSGLEVADGRFTGAMAVDGKFDATSRWSAAKQDEQWLLLDLGKTYNLDQIDLYLYAESPEYTVSISEDGTSYTPVLQVSDGSQGNTVVKNIKLDAPTAARYVKYEQHKMWLSSNTKKYGSSITELQVFSPDVVEEPDENVNLALGRPVTASTEQTGDANNNPAFHITDGDFATRWASNDASFPQWVVVDLGQTVDIARFEPTFYNSASARSYQYTISVSETGKADDYTQVVDRSANTQQDLVVDNAPEGTKGRFVRLHFSGSSRAINSGLWEFEIYGPQPAALPGLKDNLSLTDGVTATASGVEVAKFSADKAIDGDKTGDSRWSPNKDDSKREFDSWLQVDLGMLRSVQEITFRFASEPHAYEVLVSEDGAAYEQVASVTATTEGDAKDKTIVLREPKVVRYVKLHQTEQWKHSNGNYYGGSVYEFEIYQEPLLPYGAKGVLESIKDVPPTLSPDGKSIVLPASTNEEYEVTLFGSDNKQVVALDGTVHQPLVDMPVNVLYKVTNKADATDFATSEKDIQFTVSGSEAPQSGDNEKPNVVPGLREWKGGSGSFTLTSSSAIVLDAASADALAETAKVMQQYFKEMLGRDISVKTGTPAAGDISLSLDASTDYLGNEGYVLHADDVLSITASAPKGVLYGGISLTQVLYQDAAHVNFPKGTAHDYPKYEVRSGMLDVGRMYIPLEYVQEMALYMAWFKLNNMQMHINDYWGNSQYSAFRLESETYPEIVAKDGHYTKADYKQFQKNVLPYGIEVVTEIDSPYHAECFRVIDGAPMKAAGQLDIRTDETYAKSITIIKSLMDEYLDGADPVFQGNKYHIGTDEYDKAASEQMRKFTDELINYTNGKGRETRVWASLGKNGFKGDTPVSNDATVNLWAPYWADVKETYASGVDVINTDGGWLYIVPRSNANYPDRIDLKNRYDNFDVNNFASPRSISMNKGSTAIMPLAHPQTKGAQFCVWNDMTSFRGGYSEFDVYDRFKNAVAIVSEKTWYGEKTEGQTSDEFVERFKAVSDYAPGSNAGRFVASKTKVVASVALDGARKDTSGNGYDVTVSGNATTEAVGSKAVTRLAGDGALSLPFDSIGYPYTVKLDFKLDADTPANTLLFSGKDGEFYVNIDGTGKAGFKRGYHEGTQNVGYTFIFGDSAIETGKWVSLALTCGQKDTTLYLNGVAQSKAAITTESRYNGFKQQPTSYNDSTTFILPTEEIGKNMKGLLSDLQLYNYVLTAEEIRAITPEQPVDPDEPEAHENVALGKTVTASGVELDSAGKPTAFTPELTVDGDDTGASRWSPMKDTSKRDYDAWLQVDLGESRFIDEVKIKFESEPNEYEVLVSEDGESFTQIAQVTRDTDGANKVTKTFPLDEAQTVRYVKYHQTKQWKHTNNNFYGGSIYELEVYQSANHRLLSAISNTETALKALDVGTGVGQISKAAYDQFVSDLAALRTLALGEAIGKAQLDEKITALAAALETLKGMVNGVPGAPAKPTVTAANGSLSISWSAPANDGGSAITKYLLRYSDGKDMKTVEVTTGTSHTLTGLTNGTTYKIAVAAVNATGTGAYSEEVEGTPLADAVQPTVPAAPSKPTVQRANGSLTVSWSAPASDGGSAITKYLLRYSDGKETKTVEVTTGTSHTLTGLQNGTTYKIAVAAVNAAGTGAYSEETEGTPRRSSSGSTDNTDPVKPTDPVTPPTTDTKPDGTTVKTETDEKTGTVTQTTSKPDGTVITQKTEKDGTVSTVEVRKDNVKIETTEKSGQSPTATVTLPQGAKSTRVEVPVAKPSAGQVAVLVAADGTETVIPKSAVTENGVALALSGSATVKIVDKSKTFADQNQAAWANDAVAFVTARELFGGTSETAFSPNLPMTRGMLATVLYRLESKPAVSGASGFADVPADQYYADAVAWASQNNIVTGTGTGYNPNGAVTREQLAAILYRYAGSPVPPNQALTFSDASKVSSWASDAVRWAVAEGILSGKGSGALDPSGSATRAEVATMLQRFVSATV